MLVHLLDDGAAGAGAGAHPWTVHPPSTTVLPLNPSRGPNTSSSLGADTPFFTGVHYLRAR